MTLREKSGILDGYPNTKVVPMNGKEVLNKDQEIEATKKRLATLEQEKKEDEEKAQQLEKDRQNLARKQKLTNKLINLLKEEGVDLEVGITKAEQEQKQVENDNVAGMSTSKGVIVKLVMFVGLIVFFAVYQMFFGAEMNDSSRRIFDAMEAHLWTHFALSLGTILFGFGIMYLMFPCQFRYFHNQINTSHSWNKDFDSPSFDGVVRMATTFLSWVVPTWICASVMQLILG